MVIWGIFDHGSSENTNEGTDIYVNGNKISPLNVGGTKVLGISKNDTISIYGKTYPYERNFNGSLTLVKF